MTELCQPSTDFQVSQMDFVTSILFYSFQFCVYKESLEVVQSFRGTILNCKDMPVLGGKENSLIVPL